MIMITMMVMMAVYCQSVSSQSQPASFTTASTDSADASLIYNILHASQLSRYSIATQQPAPPPPLSPPPPPPPPPPRCLLHARSSASCIAVRCRRTSEASIVMLKSSPRKTRSKNPPPVSLALATCTRRDGRQRLARRTTRRHLVCVFAWRRSRGS